MTEWHSKSNHVAFLLNGIGDYVLNLPTLRALAGEIFPGELSFVCLPGVKDVFFDDLHLKEIIECDAEQVDGEVAFDVESLANKIEGCNVFCSLNTWHSPSVSGLLDLVRPRFSSGFHSCFTHQIIDEGQHCADFAFETARLFDPLLHIESFSYPISIADYDQKRARAILSCIPPNGRIMIIHADTQPDKMWPADRFRRVLDQFLEEHRDWLALIVGERNLELDSGRQSQRVIPCFDISLGVSIGLFERADLFIGVDSCMLHVADLQGIPSVGIFSNPSDCRNYGPRFATHKNAIGTMLMEDVSEITVLDALRSLQNSLAGQRLSRKIGHC